MHNREGVYEFAIWSPYPKGKKGRIEVLAPVLLKGKKFSRKGAFASLT